MRINLSEVSQTAILVLTCRAVESEQNKSRFQRPNGGPLFRKVAVYIVRGRKETHSPVEEHVCRHTGKG